MAGLILTKKTEDYRFGKQLLNPILTGGNLTIICVTHGGRKKSLTYLTENSQKFGWQKLGKYQICYVDNNELLDDTPNAYYSLVLKKLNPEKESLLNQSKEELFFLLKKFIQDRVLKGFQLVIILGHFDQLHYPTFFYNNLSGLHEIDKTKVHFIFAVARDIFNDQSFQEYGQLRELLSQNIAYFPLFNSEDILFVARSLSHKYGYKLTPSKIRLAADLSGGHPAIAKACLKIFHDHPEIKEKETIGYLSQQIETKIILEDIWNSLTESDKLFLTSLMQKTSSSSGQPPKYLSESKIILHQKDGRWQIFSPLVEEFIKKQSPTPVSRTFSLDPKTGEILINNSPPEEKLSLQEYHLLTNFLKKAKLVISRDEIADILWGKKSYEKYSDWAIDQVISQLRKRLEQMGISPKNLQTIRGRGYRWVG